MPRMTSNPAPMSWLAEMSAMSTLGASRTSDSSTVTLPPFSSRAENDKSPISTHCWEAPPMPLIESLHGLKLWSWSRRGCRCQVEPESTASVIFASSLASAPPSVGGGLTAAVAAKA